MKLLAHVLEYIAETERIEVTVTHGTEGYGDGLHLAVGHEAWTVAATFAGGVPFVFSAR